MPFIKSSVPNLQLTRLEAFGVVIAAFLSPLWFLTIGGINLNPADLIFLFVWISFVARRRIFSFFVPQRMNMAIVAFLFVASLSIIWSSNRIAGLLDALQYIFIFAVVVPLVSVALRERHLRWRVFLSVWLMTSFLTIFGLYVFISKDLTNFRYIELGYSNQNQFYWLVSIAWITSLALAIDERMPLILRISVSLLVIIETIMIFGSLTLSAIMILIASAWAFLAWHSQQRSIQVKVAFIIGTVLSTIIGLLLVVQFWELIWLQGTLYKRIPMFIDAFYRAVSNLPLGIGISSNTGVSVHNFFLSYLLELGIFGAGAFLALMILWSRDVFLRAVLRPSDIEPFEFAFIAIFGSYFLVILFQPLPVHRFWWLIFAASWAVIQGKTISQSQGG